jgi:16S rRNA (cytidine1402-2'-O)-methyltransferase
MPGKLFLIPNTLGDSPIDRVIPRYVQELIGELDHFIVENIRNARRFIIKCGYEKPIDDIKFFELNKHTLKEELYEFLDACMKGTDLGLISEAGAPAVADPGSEISSLAHQKGIRVIPLTGPSSILLSLMASGMNGQHFLFHGYLPVKQNERVKKLKELELAALKLNQTQIFIETPYRNDQLLEDILKSVSANLRLCIACDISLDGESIMTLKISEWKKKKAVYHKRPCIFLIGK